MRKIIEGWLLIGPTAGVLLLALAAQLNGLAFPSGSPKETDAGALFEKNCATCHGKDGSSKTFKAKFNHQWSRTYAALGEETV